MVRRGFTLIEMMIALAVVGILAAIAYPTYTSYVTDARQREAQTTLSEALQKQERWRSENEQYTTKLSKLEGFANNSPKTEKGFYELTASQCSDGSGGSTSLDQCVLIKAKPTSKLDSSAPTFSYNSRGAKEPADQWD